jgi:multidrug efflux pump subunit AcrA (membrane-fusion protein)
MNKGYAIGALIVLAGCSGGASEEAAPAPVALVALAAAEPGSLADTVTLYGTVEPGPAGRQALAAPVEAIVVSIEAPVGTRVAPGQVIVHL